MHSFRLTPCLLRITGERGKGCGCGGYIVVADLEPTLRLHGDSDVLVSAFDDEVIRLPGVLEHLPNRLQAELRDGFAVDLGDCVARRQASPGCRSVREHLPH